MTYTPKTIGISAAVITVAIWTSFIVVARYMALRSLTPIDIVFCRIAGASLVLIPWGFFLVRKQRASGVNLPAWLGISPLSFKITALVGLFGGVGYSVFAYSGFLFAPAAHASVLLPGTLPLMTALFSVWFLGETINRQRSLGLLLILLGGVLVGGVSIWKGLQDGGNVWVGDVLFLTASTCWASYTVLCRKYSLGAVPATVAVICFCAVFFLPSYIALVANGILKSKLLTAPIQEIAFQTVWQGMGSVVISGITFTKMIQYFGPIRSTMITALVPGLSALAAVIFLNEPLSFNLLLGLFLVTIGIVVGVRAQASKVAL
jgi:drug/metabolite transporter (DMT)-like permease